MSSKVSLEVFLYPFGIGGRRDGAQFGPDVLLPLLQNEFAPRFALSVSAGVPRQFLEYGCDLGYVRRIENGFLSLSADNREIFFQFRSEESIFHVDEFFISRLALTANLG
jgi:hypothetical protein